MARPPFNLKQRLAALSLAQSSPSSPSGAKYTQSNDYDATGLSVSPPITPNGKRKIFNTPSWLKRPQEQETGVPNRGLEHMYWDEEKRMVQEVMSKMIFQAGVDFEYVLFTIEPLSACVLILRHFCQDATDVRLWHTALQNCQLNFQS